MDYFINLTNFCDEINLNKESAMFFVYEGSISVKKQEDEFFIDDETAGTLRLISEIQNELGVNNEGVSIILNLRRKIIDYQTKIKTILESISKSESIDKLILALKETGMFENEDNEENI
ncbi:MAG: hypothetical protein M1458_04180 [Deltaproteobacteria bacterium]|nr:hypothetical protein [Deltaproteobacteria bacterium]